MIAHIVYCIPLMIDIEEIGSIALDEKADTAIVENDADNVTKDSNSCENPLHIDLLKELILWINSNPSDKLTKSNIERKCNALRRKYRTHPSKADLRLIYDNHFPNACESPNFHNWLIRKGCRTWSGVKVVTIVLSPHKFSCQYDCAMCPQEKNSKGELTQPRSYISTEPAMMRALETRTSKDTNDFDVRGQFRNRVETYIRNGIIDPKDEKGCEKIEIILSGGTWDSYPKEYREQVILEVYWVANTMFKPRPVGTLEQEILVNETARFRIIGLTLETRPDQITPVAILDYLRWGVTRIQIGVQHFDDVILKKINRKCYLKHTSQAIRTLKQAGFKVVVHLMPDLPGSSPELDAWMFDQAITNPDLQFDDLKIYPTAVCKSSDPNLTLDSKIADWYSEGSYTPYAETSLDSLINVLIQYKTKLNPWVRIQRLVRDIPEKSIESGYHKISNLRQIIHTKMEKEGLKCNCIFCREIGEKELDGLTPLLVVRKYKASQGTEYHISLEAHKMTLYQEFTYMLHCILALLSWCMLGKYIYWSGNLSSYDALFGFLRLRIDPQPGGDFVPEIHQCGLIREVHVYGTSLTVGKMSVGSQHSGYGKLLVHTAEQICLAQGLQKTAVIAGIGTREYYKNKCGYKKGQFYMLKEITEHSWNRFITRISIYVSVVLFAWLLDFF